VKALIERHMFLFVLGLSVVALAVGFLWSSGKPVREFGDVPWHIVRLPDGATRVFGMTLGRTTLAAAQDALGSQAEVTLFATSAGRYKVEAYMNDVYMAGLKARLVFSFDIPQAELKQMFSRGARISTMGSGEHRVSLGDADLKRVRAAAIVGITYIPMIDLDAQMVEHRFGKPAEKLHDREDAGVVHWLYPAEGLDVALSSTGKDVLQYVLPSQFERLRAPLLSAPAEAAP